MNPPNTITESIPKNLQESSSQNEGKQQNKPKTKKHKKRKTNHRKHPPEYYEQLKVQRLNKQRQSQWDSRFNLGVIAHNLSSNLRGSFSSKQQTVHKQSKRVDSPKQTSSFQKAFKVESKIKQKPSKSFNIRVVSKKQQETSLNKKQSANSKIKQKTQKNDQVKEQNNKLKQTENLITLVSILFEQRVFPACHKNFLLDLIQKSSSKSIKSFIHAEIARIKARSSICSPLQQSIPRRQNILQQLSTKDQKIVQKIKQLRIVTLKVIQEILRWREEWQSWFKEYTGHKKSIAYLHQGKNYLKSIYDRVKIKGNDQNFEQNPFLLGYDNNPIMPDLLVKIRACEMLLLEQELNNLDL